MLQISTTKAINNCSLHLLVRNYNWSQNGLSKEIAIDFLSIFCAHSALACDALRADGARIRLAPLRIKDRA
ncbi:hypothetical protein [Paraburkholderia dilworthii]|uniref:hypothetical protein n=1 Tax=Paraburkholderia dilworthii TaxID=948106 RepID=UPI00126791DA|nr:hypothetical protein [Paraburkholderia dilworthii]